MKKDECEELCESIYCACKKDPSLSRRLPPDAIWIVADRLMRYAIDFMALGEVDEKNMGKLQEYLDEIYAWWNKYYLRAARRERKRRKRHGRQ